MDSFFLYCDISVWRYNGFVLKLSQFEKALKLGWKNFSCTITFLWKCLSWGFQVKQMGWEMVFLFVMRMSIFLLRHSIVPACWSRLESWCVVYTEKHSGHSNKNTRALASRTDLVTNKLNIKMTMRLLKMVFLIVMHKDILLLRHIFSLFSCLLNQSKRPVYWETQ